MCGIFASEQFIRAKSMLAAMSYRGPDASKLISLGGFTMGFNRLAIVQSHKAAAAQPRVTPKGRVIAMNGEIYNYRDLSPLAPSEIAMLGDEVLDAGLDPRVYLDGDYAIAYWDPSNRLLHLYRDRWGVCPLYYSLKGGAVEVSSERRRLLAPREVPAHGKVTIDVARRRVVQVDVMTRHYGVTCSTEPNLLMPFLIEAVRRRALHSDAGFSLALSGGIDSCLVALIAAKSLGLRPREAITVALSRDSDDMRVAEAVARNANINWMPIVLTKKQLLEEAPEVLQHLDSLRAPGAIKWRAAVRSWHCAKNATSKVILTGDGSDEMLEGYPPHTKRFAEEPLSLLRHQLQSVRSMPHMNLDRTNKIGLRFSKEYRSPYLDSAFSYVALSMRKTPEYLGKKILRVFAYRLGGPAELLNRDSKWGSDEREIDALYPQAMERGFHNNFMSWAGHV